MSETQSPIAGRLAGLRAGLRAHVVRALIPAVALAVIAAGTAGAVTIVALTGTEVDASADADADLDASGAEDTSTDDTASPEDPSTGPAADPASSDEDASDDGSEANGSGASEDDAPLTFEETVAKHGAPDYSAILTRRFPGAQWSLNGSRYSGLQWLDGSAKPTQAELDALWPEVAAELAKERATQAAAEAAAAAAREAELERRRNDPGVQALLDSFDPRTIWGPNPDYAHILTRRFPGAEWSLNGNDPANGLVWHGSGKAPTKAELDAMWAEVAREMAFEMDPTELARWAGTGEQVYVDGVLRPKGWVGGANDPQPEGSVNAGVDYRYLPHIKNTNNGSPVGSLNILKDPTGAQNFEQKYGMDLTDLAARIAEAHGYFGGSHGLGLGLNGDQELMWYSDQVDPKIVEQVLAGLGALPPAPEPEPTPPAEPETNSGEAQTNDADSDTVSEVSDDSIPEDTPSSDEEE